MNRYSPTKRNAAQLPLLAFLLLLSLCPPAWPQDDDTAAQDAPPAESNTVSLEEQQVDAILADPNLSDVSLQEFTKALLRPRYHHLVTDRVFHLLGYPYYEGGLDYAAGPLADPVIAPPPPPAPIDTDTDTEPDDEPPAPSQPAPEEPNNTAPLEPTTAEDLAVQQQQLWQWMTLTHRWRQFNENPATALEVACGIELTRISTRIYERAPDQAVVVKRVMGQVGRVNRQFDRFSRDVLRDILAHNCHPGAIPEMEKLLGELPGLILRLTEGNDAISITLGAGPIDRTGLLCGQTEWIDYAALKTTEP